MSAIRVDFRYPHLIPESLRRPDLTTLETMILNPDGPGWQVSEALIEYRDAHRQASLIILREAGLGYYLKQIVGAETWLSLHDPSRLEEIICPDDWEASAGLFVPETLAWNAIREFCSSGERSSAIDWIQPTSLPSISNW